MRAEYLSRYKGLKKRAAEIVLDHLKNWDRETAAGVTHFIANSRNTQNRIKHAYRRDSVVIYPPVELERFAVSSQDDGYYLIVSALVPYKRIDLAVSAFNGLKQKLLIVGDGPELKHLKKMAARNVSFIDCAGDDEVTKYMQGCRALIFPGEEDFGIVPLEAQACGKPVIAFGKGGALETVIGLDNSQLEDAGATGVFFYEQSERALLDAIGLFEDKGCLIDPRRCRDNAMRFACPIYKKAMQKAIHNIMGD
jgi:glycosyltransferase involved in cell wall biosynthesis